MSYKVITIPKFEKELKRLAKRHPSLRKEYIELVNSLEATPVQGTPPGNNCYKKEYLLPVKAKEKVVAHVLLLIFKYHKHLYTCLLFLISPKKKTYLIKNLQSF